MKSPDHGSDRYSVTAVDRPVWWQGKGRHFLEGVPFFGPHKKVIRIASNVLAKRSEDLHFNEWINFDSNIQHDHKTCEMFYRCIKEFVSWPNCFFSPYDRLPLLMGLVPGMMYDVEDAFEKIKIDFNLFGERATEFYKIIENGLFVDFVHLVEKKEMNSDDKF